MTLALRLGVLPSALEREGDTVIATFIDLLKTPEDPEDLNPAERIYFDEAKP